MHAYRLARTTAEQAGEVAKQKNKEFRAAEAKLVDALLDAKLKGIKTEDGCNFHLHPTCFVSTRGELFDQTVAWLLSRGLAKEDFVRTEIATGALRDLCRQLLESEGTIAIPEFLDLDTTPGITAKGWKAARKEESNDE